MEPIRPRGRASDTFGAHLLEAAVRDARAKMIRERAAARSLFAAGGAMVALVALRGVLAVARPSPHGAPLVAGVLVVALVLACAIFAFAARAERRRERLARELEQLVLARATLEPDRAPAVHHAGEGPYRRSPEGALPSALVEPGGAPSIREAEVPTLPAPPPSSAPPASRSSRRASTLARLAGGAVMAGAVVVGASALHDGAPSSKRWTFDGDAGDPAVLGFLASGTRGGRWELEEHRAATGARALVNRPGYGDAPPATLRAEAMRARDLKASTRCKVTAASTGGCGLVFRFVDDANHVVARLDAVEGRVVLAAVAGGKERILGSVPAPVASDVWQEIAVEARGDHLRVLCNGRGALDVVDPAPARLGSVGLWAPAETEAYFDDLVIEVLPASPQALEVLLLRKGAG